ncbi:MAG: DUF924 family protein [Deltaproteobacteria bacterium]|jgi:uncharacterized protein (DUF924 family)
MNDAQAVLDFWFGELDAEGHADAAHKKRWWMKDPAFDEEIRTRFLALYERIVAGEHEDWRDTARGALAYIIVLDQFSRNMFRDTGRMYAADDRAVAATKGAVERGLDRELGPAERTFLYMPLMHSEQLGDQEDCVSLFERLEAELEGAAAQAVAQNVDYAKRHRDIVARFSRFPHRNHLVDRPTTDEEAEFLKQPGSSF